MNVHLYWGLNRPLSWMQFMTLVSLRRQNPGANITVWHPGEHAVRTCMQWTTGEHVPGSTRRCEDWWEYVPKYATVAETAMQLPAGLSEIHRSDLMRWSLLADGGWWSDFDILHLAPLDMFLDGAPAQWDVTLTTRVGPVKTVQLRNRAVKIAGTGKRIVPIGLIGSSGTVASRNLFLDTAHRAITNASAGEYQSCGRFALEPALVAAGAGLCVHDFRHTSLYPVQPGALRELYSGQLGIPVGTMALHWYAGHPESQAAMGRATPEGSGPSDLEVEMRRIWHESV